MKLLLALTLLFCLFSIFALDPFAERTCRQYRTGQKRMDCFRKFKKAVFDRNGITLCRSYYTLDDRVECLVKIRNMSFSRLTVRECRRMHSQRDRRLACYIENRDL